MAKSKESWNKKEQENKRKKKKEDKAKQKLEKKSLQKEEGKKSFEDMIAYVDENGRITTEAPDLTKKKKVIDASKIEISTPKQADVTEEELLHSGKVAFFNSSKGYGFIKDHDNNESYFVHINDLLEEVAENDKVTFKVEPGQRGMKAVEVKKAVIAPKVEAKPEDTAETSDVDSDEKDEA